VVHLGASPLFASSCRHRFRPASWPSTGVARQTDIENFPFRLVEELRRLRPPCMFVIFLGARIPSSPLHARLKSPICNTDQSKSFMQTQVTLWYSSAFLAPERRRLLGLPLARARSILSLQISSIRGWGCRHGSTQQPLRCCMHPAS
jgi:hypothetical protein